MSIYPDISHYHPVTNWEKIKATCPFIISKATQGTSNIDNTLNGFISGCEENEIPYWLYCYLNKGNELAQAKHMVNTCKDRVGRYFQGYILDVEAGNAASAVKTALDYLIGLGGKTMLYTMYAGYDKYADIIKNRPSACAWWEARYGLNNGSYSSKYPPHNGCDLHQYTDQGVCPGISGSADLNRLTGTKPESWFTGSADSGKDDMIYYKNLENIPEYYRTAVEKLIGQGAITGTGDGLDLSQDLSRLFTILDKIGKLG